MKELTQEEILERIETLNAEYERFTDTTLRDIVKMIVEEDYPISVAIGGLIATADSMIKTYALDDMRPGCVEILEHGFDDINFDDINS